MALTIKEKELIYVGASVSSGCKPCTSYHIRKVKESGATDKEIKQAISDAMCVRKSAAEIMEAYGLERLGIKNDVDDCGCDDKTTRLKELVSIAAAYAVNCTPNFEKHIAEAKTINITDDEINSLIKLTKFIKGKAEFHADKIGNKLVGSISSTKKTENNGGCGCDDTNEAIELKKELSEEVAVTENDDCGCSVDC